MRKPIRVVTLLVSFWLLRTARLHAQHAQLDSAQRVFFSCIESVRARRPATPTDTTWAPLTWAPANFLLHRPEAGCTGSNGEVLVWVGHDVIVDVRFVPAHRASSGPALTLKGCDDCMYAQSELVDTLHDIRIEHRRGGIAGMNALFTTRIMPCTDTLNIRVQVATSVRDAPLGLRVVNSARTTPGGLCAVSGPLDTLDAGG